MLKSCDANTKPNDRDYGFYHNSTARQASFFASASFQRVKQSGGSRGRAGEGIVEGEHWHSSFLRF